MLLVISHVISYFTIQHYVVDRRNQMVMFLVSNQLKLLHFSSQSARSEQFTRAVAEKIHLKIYSIGSGIEPEGLQAAKYHESFNDVAKRYLGENVLVKIETSHEGIYLWINISKSKNIWARVPIGDYEYKNPMELLIFMGMLLSLSLLGAWVLLLQVHRPLRRLAFAVREMGRGDYPGKLKETGPSELMAVTSAFNQMAENVHKLEEDRTLLLAGISHDLRTPITRIRLATEFLPEKEHEIKEGLIADAQEMDEIIDQFIGYVRHGSEEPMEKGDLKALIQQVVDISAKQHEGLEVQLQDLPAVAFKPMAIKRLLNNLIENAFRYGKPPVVVKTYLLANKVLVSVRDHGEGIQSLEKKTLFQPFTRGEKARSGKGSGLGLAIVAKIAEMHDAEVYLENHLSGGLEVILVLPT